MPKRVIDGEGIWGSDKIASIKPHWVKAEYANLVSLALANGTFECSPGKIWARVYSYNRREITLKKVAFILHTLHKAKLLFLWKREDGKVWGYWTGIEKPGRLPTEKTRKARRELCGQIPPEEELRAFLNSHEPTANSQLLSSYLAATPGLGLGSGLGLGLGTELKEPTQLKEPPAPAPLAYDSQKLRLTADEDAKLASVYPYVDRQQAYREAELWLIAKQTTRKNHFAFARNWLSKIPAPKGVQSDSSQRPKFDEQAWVEQVAREIVNREWPYKLGAKDPAAQKFMRENPKLAKRVEELNAQGAKEG